MVYLTGDTGSNIAPAGSTRQLNRTANDKTSAKIRFMWTIPLKSDNIKQQAARHRCSAPDKNEITAEDCILYNNRFGGV